MVSWNDNIPGDQEFAGIPISTPAPNALADSTAVLLGMPTFVGTPLYLFSDDGDVVVEQRRTQVYSLWIRGFPLYQICRELGHAAPTVKRDIEAIQLSLQTIRNIDVRQASDRSIAHLREIQMMCHQMVANPANVKQISALLNTIVRCEEQVARIEGLIIERSFQKTDATHHVKLYDFKDALPPPVKPLDAAAGADS